MPFRSHSYAIRMSVVCTRVSQVCHLHVTHIYSHVIPISLACARILSICTCIPFLGHSYVLVFNGMSLICTSMSYACHVLVCTCMSSVCHLDILVSHPCLTRMYSYAIRMSLVCTRMSSLCHLYVQVCPTYVTRMYSYVIRMSLVYTRMIIRMSLLCTHISAVCQNQYLILIIFW